VLFFARILLSGALTDVELVSLATRFLVLGNDFDAFIQLACNSLLCTLINRCDLMDLSICHVHDPICEILEANIMCYHDHSNTLITVKINEDLHDDVGAGRVQVTCRFVQ